jgi:hypothetical protein
LCVQKQLWTADSYVGGRFAFLPIFAKLAYAAGLNIVTLLAARFIIAASCFWVLLILTKTKWKVDGKSLVALFLLGAVGYGLHHPAI